jgi:hypothetical protein
MACLSCGSVLEQDIVIIGEQYPSAIFLKNQTETEFGLVKSSLNLTRCSNDNCTLVQLVKPVNLDLVYQHYPYESSGTATMREILSSVVKEIDKNISLGKDDVVLDIGGNDGTLLSLFTQELRAKVNIDIASNIKQIPTERNYFYVNSKFNASEYNKLGLDSPKVIVSVAVFYQLDDPRSFCEDLKQIMDNNSILILQMTYLDSMLRFNIFDNILHEHPTYYSLFSLNYLLKGTGLKIVGAKVVNSYGGSIRVYVVKESSTLDTTNLQFDLVEIQETEIAEHTNTYEVLYAFNSKFYFWKEVAKSLIDFRYKVDGPILGIGASTKGNMILQALEINSDTMPYILDNNPKKIGTRTTGSFIPIIDENSVTDFSRNVMVLPYYYKDFFISLLKQRLVPTQYINFITPLPVPMVTLLSGETYE